MNFYLLFSAIFAAISGLFSLTRQLQMLQQNSYFPSRYSLWLRDNFPVLPFFVFFISSLLFLVEQYLFQLIFILLYLIYAISKTVNFQKNSIKPLVFTARIKRLYSAAFIILTLSILAFVGLNKFSYNSVFLIICFILSFATPILTYLIWAVTLPVEKAFTKYYINDAKKILKQHNNLKVIGITGSYGKTTTKFILQRILSEKYNTVCTPQSFNTPMGVVRTIRESIKPKTEIFICEMGAKNIGDIKEICDIVNPQLAIITSVGPQHLETFKSVDNVFKTKFELADAVSKNGGVTYVNGESDGLIKRLDRTDCLIFGTDDNFSFKAQNISYSKEGLSFDLIIDNKVISLTSKLLGLHSVINIAGAAALAYNLGVNENDIKFAVTSLKPTEHRLEMKTSVAGSLMIDDAYNANPEGSIEAVNVLSSFKDMTKVIITPGLIELGDKEFEFNYNLGSQAGKLCDIIILVGENRSKPLAQGVKSTNFNTDNLFIAKNFFEAMDIYSKFADKNTILLIENDLPDNYLN